MGLVNARRINKPGGFVVLYLCCCCCPHTHETHADYRYRTGSEVEFIAGNQAMSGVMMIENHNFHVRS